MFSQDELEIDRKVELYDPVRKKFELSVDTTDVGNIVLFGLAKFMKYYGLKKFFFLHLSYVGKNQFIHKIFSLERVEMVC